MSTQTKHRHPKRPSPARQERARSEPVGTTATTTNPTAEQTIREALVSRVKESARFGVLGVV
jgi:hypothetical protein